MRDRRDHQPSPRGDPRYDPDLRPVPRPRESRRGHHLRVPGPQDHAVRNMGAHVEVRRGIRSASGRAELWRGLRRRLDEYSLTLRLLLKRPLAAAGLLITLLYVGIAIAASFLPDRDVLQTNFTTAYPQPPWWWGNGTPGSWFGTTYPGIDLGIAIFKAIRIDLYYSSVVIQIFAALIFIGFVPHSGYLPELGALIFYGFGSEPTSYPWTILFPGLALVIFTVGVNLLGDGLRDVLDPRLRR